MARYRPRCGALLNVTFDGRGAPNKTFPIDHVSPKHAKVKRNGYHEADTFDLVFDLKVFPFDPEGIAAIAVHIYMWDDRFGPGYNWQNDSKDNDGNLMITGLVDEESIRVDKGANEFTCSGRDYTGLLDPEWDPRRIVPAGIPLRDAVEKILETAVPINRNIGFDVVWDVKDDDGNPLPATDYLSNGAARSTKKKGLWVKPGKTTWDVIYDLVIQNGFICFVKGSSIVITNPHTQTIGQLLAVPTLVHGKNLRHFEAKRKLAKERVPRVRVVFWDSSGQRQFEAVYPPKNANDPNDYSPTQDPTKPDIPIGIGLKKNEDEIIPAPTYCHTLESALRFAKMRWELLARSETSYAIETRHMNVQRGDGNNLLARRIASFISPELDDGFDLLKLQAGDAIGVRFDPFNGEAMRALSSGQRESYLEAQGYHPRVAAFVALNYDRLEQFKQPYYVRSADYDYDHLEGLTIGIDAVNFAYERRELQFADDPADAITGAS